MREYLAAVAGARTAVIPNGVDTDYFTPREGEETPALIYAGGMNMFANRDAVVDPEGVGPGARVHGQSYPLLRVRLDQV